MATKLYDLAVKIGEYKNQAGEPKARWQNVGSVMQSADGSKFIMLSKWFNPAGVPDLTGKGATSDSLLVSMFAPKSDQPGQPAQSQHHAAKSNGYAPADISDDDIPF